jgi:hypothetical protein
VRAAAEALQEGLDEGSELVTGGRARLSIEHSAFRLRLRRRTRVAELGVDVDFSDLTPAFQIKPACRSLRVLRRARASPRTLSLESAAIPLPFSCGLSAGISIGLPTLDKVSFGCRLLPPSASRQPRHAKHRVSLSRDLQSARLALCYDVPNCKLPSSNVTIRSGRKRNGDEQEEEDLGPPFNGSLAASAGEVNVRVTAVDVELYI